jgi:ParB-like chromosome segregation protein Spo0J
MNLRLIAAYVAAFFLLVGPPLGTVRGAAPPFWEDVQMGDVNVVPDPTPSGGRSRTRAITLTLKDLQNPAEHEDEFGNRFKEKYQEGSLGDMIESLKTEKQLLELVQVFKRQDSTWATIGGHRRLAALYFLAQKHTAGFHLDMSVECLEILDASPADLMVRAISDNELGKQLDAKERLLAVQKLNKMDVSKKRGAATLGVTEKHYGREVKIVEHARVLQHVLSDHLMPTAAAAIAEVAVAKGRLDEFLDYFDLWVERKKKEIEKANHLATTETGKGLRPGKMLVMNNLEPHVVRGWLEALAKGNTLTEAGNLGFEATFDKKSKIATIKVRIDATDAPVIHLARVASQVSKVAQHLAAFAQTRHELEAPEGPQAALQKDGSFLDLNLLKTFGLQDIASDLEHELQGADSNPFFEDPTPSGITPPTANN